MVKFRLGFDIDAQTLFSMLSKFLPVDNLSVEELAPPVEERVNGKMKALAEAIALHQPTKQRKRPYKPRNPAIPIDLGAGINRIIMGALADGPKHSSEFRPMLKKDGYSPNAVGSRLQSLEKHGIVKRVGRGLWTLGDRQVTDAMRKVVRDYHSDDE